MKPIKIRGSKILEYLSLKNGLEVNVLGDVRKTKAQERKDTPVYSGVLAYFPDVFAEVSKASLAGNKQHLDGEPLHWDRSKSKDQLDAATRHLIDHARVEINDDDGVYHLAKVIWRCAAQLQLIIENNKLNNGGNNK